ncbi:type II endonuclease-methyltransferasefusion protein [Methylosinus sp. C49]|uniref:HsdM family class I SAM-dependent methyltransferase n=1 Tax=Methylosinus sp. C49 TaxID=2699395 RepID=UPI001366A4BA|nr:N-6 DNA methylase [Methylosinus sp. C49]BBU63066.1 type II endonuclease-methyltransferasefusion protein [Methylosinus sp. C49]
MSLKTETELSARLRQREYNQKMLEHENLFNPRVLGRHINAERERGIALPDGAKEVVDMWIEQLPALEKLNEQQVEQAFNGRIFGRLLGYRQPGEDRSTTLVPKPSAAGRRMTPDFALGSFSTGSNWTAVGEVKAVKTDLDLPQIGRPNRETPVEQGFRYATNTIPGIEWIVISNFREIRLYKNGYSRSFHRWNIEDFVKEDVLFEFYALMRPGSLLPQGTTDSLALRIFNDSIFTGRAITEGFYALYKAVQRDLIAEMRVHPAAASMKVEDLYGKTHKLLNRILFACFCESHPAEILPKGTLKQIAAWAQNAEGDYKYWSQYKNFFDWLNKGGGRDGVAYHAFNGGLFYKDEFFEQISISDDLFEKRYQVGKGRRASFQIKGIFGFDVYDFTEDLNEHALGAIFEQSLKDIPIGTGLVRGAGAVEITTQSSKGVYYTPREITSYLIDRTMEIALNDLRAEIEADEDFATQVSKLEKLRVGPRGKATAAETKREILLLDRLVDRMRQFRVVDPACGSGAFLVEFLGFLHREFEKTNKSLADLRGDIRQRSLVDLDREILRNNLYGQDILPESVEISKLAVWLRTAKKNERLEGLENITSADTLEEGKEDFFDVVVGNPPWGAELENWTEQRIVTRFPNCGNEKDSYAIFVNRAWELLRPGGLLAFVLPNSWLTVNGYASFRAWVIRHFEILEITNLWKIFKDVNHDACLLIARKRKVAITEEGKPNQRECSSQMTIRALPRGVGEPVKLKALAEKSWMINHCTTHAFQLKQENLRFEVIFKPEIADAIDKVTRPCQPLSEYADITVGIQVYHNSRHSKDEIKNRIYHSRTNEGGEWYELFESNTVQRYFKGASKGERLKYSKDLHDKRSLDHYAEPRILVQQIFWQRMSALMQKPDKPLMYLNTLFAVYNPRVISLECILGLLNSKFVSATYERRSNRLFGDKFPKISRDDLAGVPVPVMSKKLAGSIGQAAMKLQASWCGMREGLLLAGQRLAAVDKSASMADFDGFWNLLQNEFIERAADRYERIDAAEVYAACYQDAMKAVHDHWQDIQDEERLLEGLVKKAYGVDDTMYELLASSVPDPSISWALNAMREKKHEAQAAGDE